MGHRPAVQGRPWHVSQPDRAVAASPVVRRGPCEPVPADPVWSVASSLP